MFQMELLQVESKEKKIHDKESDVRSPSSRTLDAFVDTPLPFPEPCPPDEIALRNQALIANLKKLINNDADRFQYFRTASADYQQGLITAEEYFTRFFQIIDPEETKTPELDQVFIDLISLLPNQDKVEELYNCYVQSKTKKKII